MRHASQTGPIVKRGQRMKDRGGVPSTDPVAGDAPDLFEFVCQIAVTDDVNGGVVWQSAAPFCSDFVLPEGVPDEEG